MQVQFCVRKRFTDGLARCALSGCFVLCMGLGMLFAAESASAQSSNGDASRLYAEITEQGPYQILLPSRDAPDRQLRRGGSGSGSRDNRADRHPDSIEKDPDEADEDSLWSSEWFKNDSDKQATRTMLWTAIAIVLLFLAAYWLREFYFAMRRNNQPDPTAPAVIRLEPTPRSTPAPARAVPGYEQYANEGNYSEAVREMLMQCIRALLARVRQGNATSRTNRELMRDAGLSDSAKSAVAVLVATEELSQFGGRELNQTVYLKCLEAFNTFKSDIKSG